MLWATFWAISSQTRWVTLLMKLLTWNFQLGFLNPFDKNVAPISRFSDLGPEWSETFECTSFHFFKCRS
jgi:hypothetical protein